MLEFAQRIFETAGLVDGIDTKAVFQQLNQPEPEDLVVIDHEYRTFEPAASKHDQVTTDTPLPKFYGVAIILRSKRRFSPAHRISA
jgi:hypothetical protein